jgi:hypothetical protein
MNNAANPVRLYAIICKRDGDVEDAFLTAREAHAELKTMHNVFSVIKGSYKVAPVLWDEAAQTYAMA